MLLAGDELNVIDEQDVRVPVASRNSSARCRAGRDKIVGELLCAYVDAMRFFADAVWPIACRRWVLPRPTRKRCREGCVGAAAPPRRHRSGVREPIDFAYDERIEV